MQSPSETAGQKFTIPVSEHSRGAGEKYKKKKNNYLIRNNQMIIELKKKKKKLINQI